MKSGMGKLLTFIMAAFLLVFAGYHAYRHFFSDYTTENVYRYTQELPEFEYRLRVKAGLTGLAQVAGKYNTSPKDKLIMDLTYIQEYSLWLDVKLILRTVLVLLTPDDSTEAFEQTEEEKP